jgi:predicted kinase
MMVIMAGLPGTGKSTLAAELAKRLRGTIISKDTLRHALFDPGDVEYSTEQDDFCMELMLQTAQYIWNKHPQRVIFFDGRTFSRRYQLERALQMARELGQPWTILECVCSDETAKRRLEGQQQGGHVAGNRNYALYLAVKKRFDEITLPKAVINTDRPIETSIAEALAAIT